MPLAWRDRAEKIHGWTVLFMLSLWFSICSIYLAFISAYYIDSYCIMCILSFAVTFMLLFYTWLICKRFNIRGLLRGFKDDISFFWKRKTLSLSLLGPFLIAAIMVVTFFPVYWSFETPELTAYIPHGLTKDGHPWIGARNPKLEIIEFTDYQCFQCNKMHFFLRQTMTKHPGKIRVIHRHFPMDHEVNPLVKEPLHPGSGKLAMLTIYAAGQDKFWQMSDLLFSIARVTPNIRLRVLAEEVGLNFHKLSKSLSDRKIRNHLKKDIIDGLKLGVRGTPSFVINGQVFQGQIPPKIIQQALE
jgi:protein-disulfide isomerase